MCKWGTYKEVEVIIPANLSHTGKERKAVKNIDSCIAGIVEALNNAGFKTIASCCGHGRQPGVISLRDGREIFIMPNYESARKVNKLFPPINKKEVMA